MAKCPICGKEYVNHTEEDLTNIIEMFKGDSNIVVKMCYYHNYNYCPTCAITEMDYTPEQVEILKQNSDNLAKVMSDDNFKQFDAKKYFRICELAGYCAELIGNHDKACLGYMAAVDILDNQLLKFVKEKNKNKTIEKSENGELLFPKLSAEDYTLFGAAAQKIEYLNRLVLGHAGEAVKGSHSVAVNFALIQTLAYYKDFESARNILNLVADQLKDKGEPFKSVLKVLSAEIDKAEKTHEMLTATAKDE